MYVVKLIKPANRLKSVDLLNCLYDMIRGQSEEVQDIVVVVCGLTEPGLDAYEFDGGTLQAQSLSDPTYGRFWTNSLWLSGL